MAKGSDWYAACPHCKGSGSSSEPKEPRVHYRADGSITPNPKYTPRPSDGREKNPDLPAAKKDPRIKHGPNKKYPDYKPIKPKDDGGSSITRKPKPKSPAPGAAKKYK